MGRLFIDNEHDDTDLTKYYYCRCCKHVHNNNVEFGSGSKCTAIEQYKVFIKKHPNFNIFLL